ncbi:MAG TPA: hypothetical protein VK439_00575 [Rubrivivax sp.]|nr:hypothetical protein [Rubrivivax sp.]
MFDTPHPQIAATPALSPATARCLRAASRRDHAHAEALRRSSQANRSHACNRRAHHLSVYAATQEANAVDLLRETR